MIAPLNRIGDAHGSRLQGGAVTTPPGWKEAYKAWAEAGWNALPAPEAYGGQGLPTLLQSACIEMWNSAAFAFALGPLLTVGAIEACMPMARSISSRPISPSWSRASGWAR